MVIIHPSSDPWCSLPLLPQKNYRRHLHHPSPHTHRTSLGAAPAPSPVLPNGMSTAAPTCGDRFLGHWLATEGATRVLAPDNANRAGPWRGTPLASPPATAAAIRYRRRRRPHRDASHAASICFKWFSYFRGTLQVFRMDVAYVAMVVHVCCKRLLSTFHLFFICML